MTQDDDGSIRLTPSRAAGDALLIIDVQNDFLPGGALAVPQGDEVVPALNQYVDLFVEDIRSRGVHGCRLVD